MMSRGSLILVVLLWSAPLCAQAPATPPDKPVTLTIGGTEVRFGVDFVFAGIHDDSQFPTIGRERQIKAAYANLSLGTDVGTRYSFLVVINPADDGIVPKPYIPAPDDRRTYFFPNQPEGRGVSSDPDGIKDVDDYKYSGFDPIIQQGMLRVAYLDIHTDGRMFGATVGRTYVPQGLALDELTWFTAKDLTHIQRINAQTDNGLFLYYNARRVRVDLTAITGNGNPYHDYGYFDFTDPSEDKNSALGAVGAIRVTLPKLLFGASYRKNFLNSRVEDSISLQLSKHNDDAVIGFVSYRPVPYFRVYGEVVSYKWGLAKTSADLLPGPKVETPIYEPGYYWAVDVTAPDTRFGKWGLTITREELSRDDSLVALATARQMFGVVLGKRERGTIVKGQVQTGPLTIFGFGNWVSNPFPELSALVPISGPGTQEQVTNTKVGFGIRFRL